MLGTDVINCCDLVFAFADLLDFNLLNTCLQL